MAQAAAGVDEPIVDLLFCYSQVEIPGSIIHEKRVEKENKHT